MSTAEAAHATIAPPGWTLAVPLALLAAVLLFSSWLQALELQRLSEIATVVALIAYAAVLRASRLGPWSSGALYALLLLLFHLGWPLARTLRITFPPDVAQYGSLWFFGPYVREAIVLSVLALLAFAGGYALIARSRRPVTVDQQERPADRSYAFVGFMLVLAGAVTYIGFVAARAPQLLRFGASYLEYNATVGGRAVLASAIGFITFGLVLVAPAPKSSVRRATLVIFAGYGLFVLALGVRTAVLFPAAAAAVAAARHHRMPSGRRALAGLLLALVVIGTIRDTRNQGLSIAALRGSDLNPAVSVLEFGGTLRGVSETVSWRRGLGEGAKNGLTYVAPAQRIGERLMGRPRVSAQTDQRLAGAIVASRVPIFQIGYTPVGEAYLNFRTPGVLAFFGLLGALLARLDSRRHITVFSSATLGVLFSALALQVRNASNSVIGTVLIGLAVLAVGHFLAQTLAALSARSVRSQEQRHDGRTPRANVPA